MATIEAYIRRFREQPPAPPQDRSIPSDVEFWWQRADAKAANREELLSPISSRSSGSLRGQRYRQQDHDDEEEDSDGDRSADHNLTPRVQAVAAVSGLEDFEKRTESLMKRCDNLLSNLPPSVLIQDNGEQQKTPAGEPNPKKIFESDEFPPWVSVDLPPPIRVMPSEDPPSTSVLSPIKSFSPPLQENEDERNSPDSIESLPHSSHESNEVDDESHKTKSREQSDGNSDGDDDNEELASSMCSDTESDVSDLEDVSVETTDELIKRAERLLSGFSGGTGEASAHATPLNSSEASLSTHQPSPSLALPVPEALPSHPSLAIPEVIEIPKLDPPAPALSPVSPTFYHEIGIQTDFHPIEGPVPAPLPVVAQSLMSSTTTLYISPASSPSLSPLPHHEEDHREPDPNSLIFPEESHSTLPKQVDPSLQQEQPPPIADHGPNPLGLPTSSPSELSQALANLRYEDVEPYLADPIVSTLWSRLVIVREQKRSLQRRRRFVDKKSTK
jgi:hypothetical protein